ncbi:MAG: hypothetical protein GXX04_02315 [Clostridiaceae bacterium]|nr:hypothetical protein [Clostridiaceae bacterium]
MTHQREPVNILIHCNAGWLAFVDYGTATAPIYAAHEKGIKVHVYVDETRPLNQGGKLSSSAIIISGSGGYMPCRYCIPLFPLSR